MPGSLRLLNLLGFDVRVHWSWILIFLLITWTFSVGLLHDVFPDWATETRWLTAAAVALVFFLSILFHELAHSLVARRLGMPISSITLFVFGGVSNVGREARTPREEFLVAIVGPLSSVAFAIGFGLLALLFDPVSDGVSAIFANLAGINLALAIFNMVPGFPLDGGRVLRSALWKRSGDLMTATRQASQIGEWVAYSIMGIGVLSFFLVSVISGIWLFLIGNFLRAAAITSYQQLVVSNLLSNVPARRLARIQVRFVPRDASISDLVNDYILRDDETAFPVGDDGRLVGVISKNEVLRLPREEWPLRRVEEEMTPLERTHLVDPDEDLAEVVTMMGTQNLEQVPVGEDGAVRGLLYRSDIMRYIETHLQFEDTGEYLKQKQAA